MWKKQCLIYPWTSKSSYLFITLSNLLVAWRIVSVCSQIWQDEQLFFRYNPWVQRMYRMITCCRTMEKWSLDQVLCFLLAKRCICWLLRRLGVTSWCVSCCKRGAAKQQQYTLGIPILMEKEIATTPPYSLLQLFFVIAIDEIHLECNFVWDLYISLLKCRWLMWNNFYWIQLSYFFGQFSFSVTIYYAVNMGSTGPRTPIVFCHSFGPLRF